MYRQGSSSKPSENRFATEFSTALSVPCCRSIGFGCRTMDGGAESKSQVFPSVFGGTPWVFGQRNGRHRPEWPSWWGQKTLSILCRTCVELSTKIIFAGSINATGKKCFHLNNNFLSNLSCIFFYLYFYLLFLHFHFLLFILANTAQINYFCIGFFIFLIFIFLIITFTVALHHMKQILLKASLSTFLFFLETSLLATNLTTTFATLDLLDPENWKSLYQHSSQHGNSQIHVQQN